MPRQPILSAADRAALLRMPQGADDLRRHYSFDGADMALIRRRRGAANRLGFAVQLASLRYPGFALAQVPQAVVGWVADQVQVDAARWAHYGAREETRREHVLELRAHLGLTAFGVPDFRALLRALGELAMRTDNPLALAEHAMATLRQRRLVLPSMNVIDRACAEALAGAKRRIDRTLTRQLGEQHRSRLDDLLQPKPQGHLSWLTWLRQSPSKQHPQAILEHLARLKALHALALPEGTGRRIHPDRLRRIACEGMHMPVADFMKCDSERRHAILAALVGERIATITDEIIELHDAILSELFNSARAKYARHLAEQDQSANGRDAAGRAAPHEPFGELRFVREQFSALRRYTSALLEVLPLRAKPNARNVLDAVKEVRRINAHHILKVAPHAPTAFIKPAWRALVIGAAGIDRRLYEICTLDALQEALRAGDIWVDGSRHYSNFDEHLLPAREFKARKLANTLALAVDTDCDRYLRDRTLLLEARFGEVSRLASAGRLPGVIVSPSGLAIAPDEAAHGAAVRSTMAPAALRLPRVRITELLMEVDEWTGFTRHFVHLKDGKQARDKSLLLSVILADGLNLGLNRMADAGAGTSYSRLAWLQAWHVREENYAAALAALADPCEDTALLADGHCPEHAFALARLVGMRCAPAPFDLASDRLYAVGNGESHAALAPLIGGALDLEPVRAYWPRVLRLAASISAGKLPAPLALRRYACHPHPDGVGVALRELGRVERSLSMLDWLQDAGLRARMQAEQDRRAASGALARTLYAARSEGMCERMFEHQRDRSGGLKLLTQAILLWNAVQMKRAWHGMPGAGSPVGDAFSPALVPPRWEHIDFGAAEALRRQHA